MTADEPLPDPGQVAAVRGRTVLLVGLMGAGKSSVGRRLATLVDLPFVDSDAEVEAAAQCTIAEIFERFGEAGFRDGERRVMARLLQGPPCVLAAGGGAFLSAETRALAAQHARSVWLRAALDELVRRTSGKSHRPLLNGVPLRARLAELMAERDPIYALADATVETSGDSPDVTAHKVLITLAALADHRGTP